MKIFEKLEEIGLKKNKSEVYVACLELGFGSAAAIAKRVKLPRTTTIGILKELVVMGLVSYSKKGNKYEYIAESPEKLKKMILEKERKVNSLIPELKSLAKTRKQKRPQIRIYEGVEGVKSVFEDTLTVKEGILRGILSMEDLYQIPGKRFMDYYVKKRIGAEIKLNVIRSEQKEVEETWSTSKKESRELRYAPAGLVFPMTTYIYDNKVAIISTVDEHFGMIIQSDDYFITQKQLFETMWDVSRISKSLGNDF